MPPNHLAVYLSNRCNLNCKYCYVAINQGEPTLLSFEHLKHDIDFFFAQVPGDHDQKKITFLGGEPFLNFPLLQRAVDYVRETQGKDIVLQTFTNGVNISQDKLDWCDSRELYVTVSLDGMKETNDRVRVFWKDESRSVFDTVMERLAAVRKDRLGVSLVFDTKSVGRLLKNIDFFYKQGFSRITFNPELYELWPEEKLAELRAVMQGFKRYYGTLLRSGARPFTVPILFSVLETERGGPSWWHECHNVVLGSDDKFYSCDKALTFPYAKIPDADVGSAAEGMDWKERGRELGEARAVVEKTVGAGHRQYFCPMGVVFYSKYAGQAPETLLRNFTAVSDIFGTALTELVAENRDTPAFRSLYRDVHLV